MSRSDLIESQISPPLQTMKIRWDGLNPSKGGMVTLNSPRFGMTRNGGTRAHLGIDLDASIGTPIFAVADGVIEYVDIGHPKLGIHIFLKFKPVAAWRGYLARAGVEDSDGVLFAHYAHLSIANVQKGQRVRRKMLIGLTGVSGSADQAYPHLHFEFCKISSAGKGVIGLHNRIDPERIFRVDFSAPLSEHLRVNHIA